MQPQTGSVIVNTYGQTDVGCVRKNNEDALVIADLTSATQIPPEREAAFQVGNRGVLLAVSDGMGGAEAGEVASSLVVESLRQHLGIENTGDLRQSMLKAVEAANRNVWEAAHEVGRQGMGATLVAVLVFRDLAHVAAVGDSRVYLIRRHRIRQVTKDQSYVELLINSGMMTRAEAEVSPYKNVILQAMGQRPNLMVALGHLELRRNDVFLICSDGLSGKVKDEEMYDIVTGSKSFKEASQRLIDLAKERGGEDNITVVIAHVSGEGVAEPGVGERVTETLKNVQEYDPRIAAALSAAKPPEAAPPPRPAAPAPPPPPASPPPAPPQQPVQQSAPMQAVPIPPRQPSQQVPAITEPPPPRQPSQQVPAITEPPPPRQPSQQVPAVTEPPPPRQPSQQVPAITEPPPPRQPSQQVPAVTEPPPSRQPSQQVPAATATLGTPPATTATPSMQVPRDTTPDVGGAAKPAAGRPGRRFKWWYLIPVVLVVSLVLVALVLFGLEYFGVTDIFVDDIDDIF